MQPNPANDNNQRPAAFDAALTDHLPAIRMLANRHVPYANRDDVVQDVIAYAIAHWEQFRPANGDANTPGAYKRGGGFYTWLYWQFRSVTANYRRVHGVRRQLDKKHRLAERPEEYGVRKSRGATTYPLGPINAPQERALIARDIMERLPNRGGAVLIKRAAGFGQKEIAADMGLSHQRVSQIEQSARDDLKGVAA